MEQDNIVNHLFKRHPILSMKSMISKGFTSDFKYASKSASTLRQKFRTSLNSGELELVIIVVS